MCLIEQSWYLAQGWCKFTPWFISPGCVCVCVCVHQSPLPCNLDVIVRGFGHEEFAGDLHLGRLRGEVAEEAAFLLDQEELGQLLGLGLQDFDPLFQLGDQVVKLHGAGHAEVKV